jgi:DNA polymerase III sliding clamp (beta) subunit (PCNA family)
VKAQIDGRVLADAAALAESVSDAKATNEILGFVRVEFDAFEGVMTLLATDGEQRVRVQIRADIKTDGAVLVEAKKLQGITERLASGPITLAQNAEKSALIVKGSGSRFSLACVADPETFPKWRESDDFKQYLVPADLFLTGLKNAAGFVAGPQDSRYQMRGVHVVFGTSGITLEATDGHRLTEIRVPAPDGAGEVPASDIVVPPNLFRPASLLLKSGQPVTVVMGQSEVGFCTPDIQLFGRLIEGQYVPFQQHLTTILKNERVAFVKVDPLVEAVRRVEIVTEHLTRPVVKLQFTSEPVDGGAANELALLVTDEADDTDTKVAWCRHGGSDAWEPGTFAITLQSQFLLDFLALLPGPTDVEFRFGTDMTPMALVGDGGNPRGAILPIARPRPAGIQVEPAGTPT